MARQTADRPKVTDAASRQEGSRWVGDFPAGEEVASWFVESVHLHDGMDHAPYLPGITLISSTETIKRLVDGAITEVERLVHVPYAKVETRVAYFWDWCLSNFYLGEIKPVPVPRVNLPNMLNEHLPPGFFRVPVQQLDGKFVHFIATAMKVTVYEPDMRTGGKGRVILDAPPAVKQIAMIDRFGRPDPFALMKAETGAVGRALGMAGMLVLPGSGVATYEDMVEALAEGGARGAATAGDAEAPDVVAAPADPLALIRDHSERLESEAPGKLEEIREWARGRSINLDDPKPTQYRAIIAQLERKVAELPS